MGNFSITLNTRSFANIADAALRSSTAERTGGSYSMGMPADPIAGGLNDLVTLSEQASSLAGDSPVQSDAAVLGEIARDAGQERDGLSQRGAMAAIAGLQSGGLDVPDVISAAARVAAESSQYTSDDAQTIAEGGIKALTRMAEHTNFQLATTLMSGAGLSPQAGVAALAGLEAKSQ